MSGTIMAIQLLKHLKDVELYLFERNAHQLYRGIAYSSSMDYQPLNVPAEKMNISTSETESFYNWLKLNWRQHLQEAPSPNTFVSRRVFGDFLEEKLKGCVSSSANIKFNVINAEVVNLKVSGETASLYFENKVLNVDYVVLALGLFPPGDLQIKNKVFNNSSLLESNPWDGIWMQKIKSHDDILFIGSGLTTVELVANLLHNANYLGKISILSRRGLLPRRHEDYLATTINKFPAREKITCLDLVAFVKGQLKQFSTADWRNIIDDLRADVPRLWSSMSLMERKRFLRHLRQLWEVHRHRAPAYVLDEIYKGIQKGRVELMTGRVENITEQNGLAYSEIKLRDKTITAKFHRVINASGPESNCRKWNQSLVSSMLRSGIIHEDPLGLGINANLAGQLIDKNGALIDNMFAMGALRKGSAWECTAAKEITHQAIEIVSQIKFCSPELARELTVIE